MNATTQAILTLADTLPGGREALLSDIVQLLSERKYLSPQSVASMLDVSLPTIKNWRAQGLLIPSLKVPGGTVRYTLADVNKFLQRHTGREEAKE